MLKIDKTLQITRTIDLSIESEKLINENYFKGNKGYEYELLPVNEIPSEIKGICIIHMYPEKDTVDPRTNEMTGYDDSLFFRIIIYDCENSKMYDYGLHDEIDLQAKVKLRTFKDMSTMIIIKDGCKIGSGQSFSVYPL